VDRERLAAMAAQPGRTRRRAADRTTAGARQRGARAQHPGDAQILRAGFSGAPLARNFVVPNGFDAVPAPGALPATGTIDIVHAGEIYNRPVRWCPC
jgi:hypothetical protein